MRRSLRRGSMVLLSSALAAAACAKAPPPPAPPTSPSELDRALAIDRTLETIAHQRTLWPSFEPLSIPLAVFTGKHTYLFRHPQPPEGFTRVAGSSPAAFVFDGRHPEMTANSSADIGGTVTATVIADDAHATRTPTQSAALALHESFHVHQRAHHPGWIANEGALFLYPVDDAHLLALRRLETDALRRAVAASNAADSADAACWARRALTERHERFAAMDSTCSAYERNNEWNEGLAAYIQLLAAEKSAPDIPAQGFAAEKVRDRLYATGTALAVLLDRFDADWKNTLERDDSLHLDTLLEQALGTLPTPAASCALGQADSVAIVTAAQQDAAAVTAQRSEHRKSFEALGGWRVIVQAAQGQPLMARGFDPLNVERVDGGVLHTRMLALGNDSGSLRAIDGDDVDLESFTEGVGPHPFFSGVRRAVIAGLSQPQVEADGDHVVIHAPGLTFDFQHASVRQAPDSVVVHLLPVH